MLTGRICCLSGLLALLLAGTAVSAWAQANPPAKGNTPPTVLPLGGMTGSIQRVPGDDYFVCLATYYSGDYAAARRGFIDVSRGGLKSLDGARWVDSICYHTMLGECHYQMGDLVASLEQHNNALAVYLANLNWLLRVDFPAAPDVLTKVAKIPTWGASTRTTVLGRYPDTMRSFQGQTDAQNAAALQKGGVIAQGQLYPVQVMEILRCIAVSLRRRAELVGPTGGYDPLSQTILDAVMRRPAPANHWSQCWIDLQIGLAQLAAAKPAQAASELQKSLLVGGQFEHPMTCLALLELGRIAQASGQWDNALAAYMEATYSAAVYAQYDVLEEAFRGAVTTHLLKGNKTYFAPLDPAIVWADRTSTSLQASLLVLSAENLLAIGEPARGMAQLVKARALLGRHDALAGQVGARYHFELAKANFQAPNLAAGTTALATAMAFQSKGSRRLFQTILADNLYTSGIVSDRAADALFAEVLREPQPNDWSGEPMETLAVMMTPRALPMEHWFEVALKRNEPEKACEIADRLRRQRFFSSLPLGGRMLALRWILGGPAEALGERGNLQRRDILAKYPAFVEWSRQATDLRTELARAPLTTEDTDAFKAISQKYDQLGKISAAQELLLHDMAVQRVPADYAFPPLIAVKDVQARLPEQTLILAYFNGVRGLYGFAITKDKYQTFKIESPNKLRNDLADMLKKLGLRDRTQPLESRDLQDDAWQPFAQRLIAALTNNVKPEAWNQYREVVIVPDGVLWYCPFEMLPIGVDSAPLLTRLRVRYVPTVSLAIPDGRPARPLSRTAVVAGRIYPRDDLKVAAEAAEELEQVLPDVARLPNKLPGPSSLVAKFCDRLIVYHDMDDAERAPYDWSPVQIDQKRPGSNLGSLLSFPWGGPQQVIFPGFHTPAEAGFKKAANGDDVFLTLCGLMATGTQTALLSRWRVGGQSSFDLVREFAQELPHEPASVAWQRSVLLRMQAEVDLSREPRVRLGQVDEPIRAEHPFFWAGYLLSDTGTTPVRPEAQVAK